MKGLILKDLYMAAKYLKIQLAVLVLFIAVSFQGENSLSFVFLPCMICGMIPETLLSYDERSKWDVYCGTLPCSKAQIVSAKYLIGVMAQLFVLIAIGIAQFIKMNISGGINWPHYLTVMAMLFILSCITSSIQLPFMFKFGTEKGRIAYYVMVAFASLGSVLAAEFIQEGALQNVSALGMLPPLCLAAAGLYALSWYLSIRFYEKREI